MFISRDAAIQFFNEWADDLDKQINDSVKYPHLRSDYKVCKTQIIDCIHAIEEMPAADVRPVAHGEWEPTALIPVAYDIDGVITWASEMRCSKCGFSTKAIEGRISQYNFCPNCGADNRELTANGN